MKIIKNTIKTLRFQRLDNEGEPITSTPEELRVVIKKDDHATASIVKTLSNGDIKWTQSDLSWFFTIETPETGHLELGAYGLRVFETVGGVEYQVYETEMRVVELYSDPGDDKKYPSPSAGINFYQAAIRADDESDARGIFCGTVTNGDLFPTTRPDGTPLQNEDYARPDSNSTFPFDVENVTFSSIRDKAYYINGTWMLDAGALQDTSETPLKDKTAESLSGTATNQKVVNVENKNVIEDIQEDIEELEENKVDKTSTAFQAYATDNGGSQTTITYNSASSVNTIVKRDGDGRFEASAPVSDLQVSNKKYVDDEVIKKVKDVKLDGSSIVNTDKEALLTKTNIINSIKDESKTFTNTTLDIDSNTLSNVEVDNFKGSAVATTISTSATNNKLATEKAVKDYADGFAKSIARDSTDLKLKDANNNVLSTVTGDDLQTCTKDVTATLKNKTLDFNDNNRLNNFEDNTTIIKDADSKLTLNKDNDTIQYDATNKIFARNFKEVSTFVGETGKSHVLYYLNSNISGYNKGMYKWDATNNVFAPIATNGELGGFVGYVDNTTASLPTTRPSGATLQEGDFMLVSTSSTFPFTIGGMTSTNRNDLFIYKNNAWSIRDGQDVLIEVATLPTSGIKTNVVYRLNDNGKISYHTYYSGEWRKIIDDETLKEYLRGFKFVGYVSTSEPTGTLRKDELWYNSVSGTMPTVFPINVKRYDGTTWSTTTEEYTPTSMDLWSNKNNDKGYYWFGNSWNIIDTTVEVDNVTTELNSYGQIQIKDSGVSTAKIADAAVTKAKIATDAKVVYEEDTQTIKNKTIDADDNTILDITGANLKAQTTSDAKKTWVVQNDGSWALGKAGSDVDDITIEEVSDKLQVKDGGLTVAKMNDNSLAKSTTTGAENSKVSTQGYVDTEVDKKQNRVYYQETEPSDAVEGDLWAWNSTDIGGYLPLSGGTLTGNLSLGGNGITNLATPVNDTDASTKSYVDTKATEYLPLSGGTMTGDLTFNNNKKITDYLPLAGGSMTGTVTTSATNFLKRDVDNSFAEFFGATAYNKGAYFKAYGKDHSGAGKFELHAHNGTTDKTLAGTPSGGLTWEGKSIQTSGTIKLKRLTNIVKPAGTYSVSISATPDSGYSFLCWVNCASAGTNTHGYIQYLEQKNTLLWSAEFDSEINYNVWFLEIKT